MKIGPLLFGVLSAAILGAPLEVTAARTGFELPGRNHGVWQLTDDPAVRHWANYHNVQSFSPDGRYVCYALAHSSGKTEVKLFDLHRDLEIDLGEGIDPRWAKHHNWLFFVHYNPEKRTREVPGTQTILFDVDAGRRSVLMDVPGAEVLGETTFDDQWLIGAQRFRRQDPEFRHLRIRLPGGGFERMPQVTGSQLLPNPRHPVFFSRHDHRADPFEATRFFFDLDGGNRRIGVPTLQQCHMSWLGNGKYLLLGNGLVRGRQWNEPFPSNVHVLAGVAVGDISPCGASGRWVCGDSTVADLRSGDGWEAFHPLSVICFPEKIGDNSGIYDADPKGSPDGTKVSFVSNYPLNGGPQTRIVAVDTDSIAVEATAGFPDQGYLVVQREVIRYGSRTGTTFNGLVRKAFGTAGAHLRPDRIVTSFEARCLTEARFQALGRPHRLMRQSISEADSPLLRQRMTDVFVAVVRKPDRPWLERHRGGIRLIPGENHREIRGFRIFRDGSPTGTDALIPGQSLVLTEPGPYEAVAVEWSGLESDRSNRVRIGSADLPVRLHSLPSIPDDFSWTTSKRTPDGTLRETVHKYDGVIQREWFENGVRVARHDLNEQGKATRRVSYKDGKIEVREYHDRTGHRVSREKFDADGFVVEFIQYREGESESDHWWYDRGWPVKRRRGRIEWIKRNDRWGRFDNGRWVDTPR